MQSTIHPARSLSANNLAITESVEKERGVPARLVLIADDDADLCDLYRRFFSRHGWEVQLSQDGVECLGKLRDGLPGFLIVDLQLRWGGADGLLEVMRDDPCLASVPVVLTSTTALPETFPELTLPPVVQVLEKPFSLATLLHEAEGFSQQAK